MVLTLLARSGAQAKSRTVEPVPGRRLPVSEGYSVALQSSCFPPFWWNLGTFASVTQESPQSGTWWSSSYRRSFGNCVCGNGSSGKQSTSEVSSDDSGLEAITPNHFLICRANPVLPCGVFSDKEISSKKRWRQAQVVLDHFWNRWLKEYLPALIERKKWICHRTISVLEISSWSWTRKPKDVIGPLPVSQGSFLGKMTQSMFAKWRQSIVCIRSLSRSIVWGVSTVMDYVNTGGRMSRL